MADLYGTNESEEMSSFLHNLLHNSLTSPIPPPTNEKQKHSLSSPPPQSATPTTGLVSGLPIVFDSDSRFRAESSAGYNFSDPGRGFMADARDCAKNTFSAVSAGDSHGITSMFKRKFPEESDFDEFGSDCKGSEASDNPMNPALPRSTKRSRAAEVHNLSEKRRRCRINEKMKALQKLIPNSNKTDKASMLDEVIEYLKQLQLQVQMLSMRNGLNLHPLCFPESLHPTLLPQPVISFDEGNEVLNSNRGQDTFSRNQEISMQAPFDLPSQCTLSNQPNLLSPMTNINHSESPFRLEPSIQNHYGPFNHLTPSKELCREDRLSQLQLDASRTGKNSSSGVSS